jgi:hypothetical protein
MEELFNLTYKDEVDSIKDEDSFEAIGDEQYIYHQDMEARLYWAFCRPSGSHPNQIKDPHPLVSIMAFNHSRLGALKRFSLLNSQVIADESLRTKIRNRARMLFRDLVDNDFKELNEVLDIVPIFLPVAIDQLKNGRLWNDIVADEIEATKLLHRLELEHNIDEPLLEGLYRKLTDFSELEPPEFKSYLQRLIEQKESISSYILDYYQKEAQSYIDDSHLHILQKKQLDSLVIRLV